VPHTGARPSVRLCVGPELSRCVHDNSNYAYDFYDLTGIYFDSTSQTNSNINIDELDIFFELKKQVE